MKSLSQFRKEMKGYFEICVFPEEGETFEDWFECLMEALEEDGCVVRKDGRTYIK